MVKLVFIGIMSSWLVFSAPRVSAGDPTKPQLGGGNLTQNSAVASRVNKLTAIFDKQGRKSAVINGKLYRKGDFIDGRKIIAINNRQVVLSSSNGKVKLVLIKVIKN